MSIQHVLLLPHLKVHNANALASPFTIGFPALTGFLGAVHALERKLNQQGLGVKFNATGVVSHDANLQTYKGTNDFTHSIIGTGNPLDKTGARSAFIEEARIHLDVSLILSFTGIELSQYDDLKTQVTRMLSGHMKIAGGDLFSHNTPQIHVIDTDEPQSLQKLQRQLMPGYLLVERRDLMIEAMEQRQDALDAVIDYLAVHHRCEIIDKQSASEHDEANADLAAGVSWTSGRKTNGWIVPIATGFQGISELSLAKNQRDETTPHRFAESVVTLGEFKMPHRVNTLDAMLWHYHSDQKADLYLCQQHQIITQLATDIDYSEGDDEDFGDE